jgi:hypothetical protein
MIKPLERSPITGKQGLLNGTNRSNDLSVERFAKILVAHVASFL